MSVTDPLRPTVMTRLVSRWRGEVTARTVEARRRAGRAVFSDLVAAEQLRDDLAGREVSLWLARPGQRSQLLCTWNAFALHVLGDELIEADYRADPHTVGYLPRVTERQALAFFEGIELWSARARRAARDPNFDIGATLELPAPLPEWIDPAPPAHMAAALAAAGVLRDRAQGALADYTRAGVPDDKRELTAELDGKLAETDALLMYAESLRHAPATAEVRGRTATLARRALRGYYTIGQLLAMPTLLRPPPAPHLQPWQRRYHDG
jgi:hypothetical protein